MQIYWDTFAHNYRNLDSPMTPNGEDVATIEAALAHWRVGYAVREPTALLCGVTPALADLAFPARARMLAVDQSEPMIRTLWPGDGAARWVVRGDWLALPMADRSCDIVLGDGCFNCMEFPRGYRALASALESVLTRGGIMLMRFFVRPDRREEVESIFAELLDARIPSFHVFKWRLAMALQPTTATGIVVNDVYEKWAASGIRPGDLTARLGWSEASIGTIVSYKGKGTRLSFPTIDEARASVREHFEETFIRVPGYPLGDRCPMFALTPRDRIRSFDAPL